MLFEVKNTAIKFGKKLYPIGSQVEMTKTQAAGLEKYLTPVSEEQPAAAGGADQAATGAIRGGKKS